MKDENEIQQLQLLTRFWSDREEKRITVRVEYSFRQEGGCRVYTLGKVETLD